MAIPQPEHVGLNFGSPPPDPAQARLPRADGDPHNPSTWALTLVRHHRTQRVADEAINRALDCSLTSHRGAPWSTPHVTCVTRHAQNAKPTSRCRTVAPWS